MYRLSGIFLPVSLLVAEDGCMISVGIHLILACYPGLSQADDSLRFDKSTVRSHLDGCLHMVTCGPLSAACLQLSLAQLLTPMVQGAPGGTVCLQLSFPACLTLNPARTSAVSTYGACIRLVRRPAKSDAWWTKKLLAGFSLWFVIGVCFSFLPWSITVSARGTRFTLIGPHGSVCHLPPCLGHTLTKWQQTIASRDTDHDSERIHQASLHHWHSPRHDVSLLLNERCSASDCECPSMRAPLYPHSVLGCLYLQTLSPQPAFTPTAGWLLPPSIVWASNHTL